ncbi:hypothetical protein [Evansella cellulosilytica]|uniref:SHSP domain-containing protein n=1 Tax=Evansella cellulosilytica (strain ATCC 21833 / DSM 2522 / FERM P-1141 / JCM 9156 / N-4) TaxID=649639 RepID=E6TYT1_EVAC2|nr:hypothetical protein [Evansella cellulosilytica]ADU31266.1 hypothetical protein Bcell_3016 [Evansella cellulosilytica DSM 2522]
MVNRPTNQPFGNLFNFPFFDAPQRQQFNLNLHVQDTPKELIIQGTLEGFNKENVQLELVRNGVLVSAQQPVTEQTVTDQETENEDEAATTESTTEDTTLVRQRAEQFVPVYFPFTEEDVTAVFSDENVLKIVIAKNDANRKFITID